MEVSNPFTVQNTIVQCTLEYGKKTNLATTQTPKYSTIRFYNLLYFIQT